MLVLEYYHKLEALKAVYSALEPKGIGCIKESPFDPYKSATIRFKRLLNYINADVVKQHFEPLPISGHEYLHIHLNSNHLGYIERIDNKMPTNHAFSNKQIEQFIIEGFAVIEACQSLMVNPRLIDYVGRNRMFDYESLICLFETLLEFLTALAEVIKFNNLRRSVKS